MIVYTVSHAPLLILFFYYIYRRYYSVVLEIEEIIDPIKEYINNSKEEFLKTYDNSDTNMSENIEPIFYNKKDYTAFMKTDKNEIETLWKTRILHENTPKGSIVMFYDAYKQAFTYYTDHTSMPVTILNAVAMKYVMRFSCRDFYQDEQTFKVKKENTDNKKQKKNEEDYPEDEFIENTYISPLIKIHNEKEETTETKNLKTLSNNAAFVRLKSYNNANCHDNNEKNVQNKKLPQDKNVNKFVSLGKMYNCHTLQNNKPQLKPDENTKYDEMFKPLVISNVSFEVTPETDVIKTNLSYKDFKLSKQD